jgi:hypothetical protein
MARMRRLGVIAALTLVAATAPAGDVAQSLAGRYYKQFADALVSGEKYTGEDIVEIVPVGPHAAYLNVHLDYYNGHTCKVSGLARQQGDALVYRDDPQAGDSDCTLKVSRNGGSLTLDDTNRAGDATCAQYCGARGSLSGATLPYASQRPIRYMPRLKASQDYRDAVAEYAKGKGG